MPLAHSLATARSLRASLPSTLPFIDLPEEHIMARQQYTPSPTEIRRECERIRSEWSEDTLWKRSGLEHCRHWMPPTVHMPRTHELIETITDP